MHKNQLHTPTAVQIEQPAWDILNSCLHRATNLGFCTVPVYRYARIIHQYRCLGRHHRRRKPGSTLFPFLESSTHLSGFWRPEESRTPCKLVARDSGLSPAPPLRAARKKESDKTKEADGREQARQQQRRQRQRQRQREQQRGNDSNTSTLHVTYEAKENRLPHNNSSRRKRGRPLPRPSPNKHS